MAPRKPTRLESRSITRSSQMPAKPSTESPQIAATRESSTTAKSLPNPKSRLNSDRLSSLRHPYILKSPNNAGVRKRLARSRRRKEKAAKLNLASLTSALDVSDPLLDSLNSEEHKNKHDNNHEGGHADNSTSQQKDTNKHVPDIVKAMRQHKSLGSKKGATKRRVQIGKLERERWKRNWDVLNSGVAQDLANNPVENSENNSGEGGEKRRAEQWAALRSHIAGNMGGLNH